MTRTVRKNRRPKDKYFHEKIEKGPESTRDGLTKRRSNAEKFDKRQRNRDIRHDDKAMVFEVLDGEVDADDQPYSVRKNPYID